MTTGDRNTVVDALHRRLTPPWRVSKVPYSLRDDWKQQMYVELLDLWSSYAEIESPVSFEEYAQRRIGSRMKRWWNSVKAWADVNLAPDFDPDDFETETAPPLLVSTLTPLENRVWTMLVLGFPTDEIAERIGKSADTVRHILSDIYDKEREARRKEDAD